MAKALEIEADLRKYQERLNGLRPGDPDFDKLMTKVRKLQLQNDYMNENASLEATRIRITDEISRVQAAQPPVPAVSSTPTNKAKSTICAVM